MRQKLYPEGIAGALDPDKRAVRAMGARHRSKTKRYREEAASFGIGYYRWEALLAYGDGDPKCICCGERGVAFLQLDHVNGGGKRHRELVGRDFYRTLRLQGYPPGLRVLCANCNWAMRPGEAVCQGHATIRSGHSAGAERPAGARWGDDTTGDTSPSPGGDSS